MRYLVIASTSRSKSYNATPVLFKGALLGLIPCELLCEIQYLQ